MGVKGLKGFISHHTSEALLHHNLANCRILIDGHNLAYYLHNLQTETNSAFGGDYDAYVEQIDIFFQALEKCRVECCVIMDGGVDQRQCSMQHATTTWRRNTHTCLRVTPQDQKEAQVFPPLGMNVFIAAVRANGVTVLQADNIADDELVTVAATFGLPVLSDDTDFCLRGVAVISLTSVTYRDQELSEDGGYFVRCRMFNKDKFCELLGINPAHLLFLSALGLRDNITVFHLGQFYEKIATGVRHNSNWTNRLFKINLVNRWLSQNKSKDVSELIEMVVEGMPKYQKKANMLRGILSRMVRVSPYASKLLSWFSSDPTSSGCGHAAYTSACEPETAAVITQDTMVKIQQKRLKMSDKSVHQYSMQDEIDKVLSGKCTHAETGHAFAGGLPVPNWFAINQKQYIVQYEAAELFIKKTLFTSPMVEKLNRKSACLIALPLVQVIQAIGEKTFREHQQSYWEDQIKVLTQSGVSKDLEKAEVIKVQVQQQKVNYLKYEQSLRKLRNKARKESIVSKPKTKIDKMLQKRKTKKSTAHRNKDEMSGVLDEDDLTGLEFGQEVSSPSEYTTLNVENDNEESIKDYLNWFKKSVAYNTPEKREQNYQQASMDETKFSNGTEKSSSDTALNSRNEFHSNPAQINGGNHNATVSLLVTENHNITNMSRTKSCENVCKRACDKELKSDHEEVSDGTDHDADGDDNSSSDDELLDIPLTELLDIGIAYADDDAFESSNINSPLWSADNASYGTASVQVTPRRDQIVPLGNFNVSFNNSTHRFPGTPVHNTVSFGDIASRFTDNYSDPLSRVTNSYGNTPTRNTINCSDSSAPMTVQYYNAPVPNTVSYGDDDSDADVIIEQDSDDSFSDCEKTLESNASGINSTYQEEKVYTEEEIQDLLREMAQLELERNSEQYHRGVDQVTKTPNGIDQVKDANAEVLVEIPDDSSIVVPEESCVEATTGANLDEMNQSVEAKPISDENYEHNDRCQSPKKKTCWNSFMNRGPISKPNKFKKVRKSIATTPSDFKVDSDFIVYSSEEWQPGSVDFTIKLLEKGTLVLELIRKDYAPVTLKKFEEHFKIIRHKFRGETEKVTNAIQNLNENCETTKKEFLDKMEEYLLNQIRAYLEDECRQQIKEELEKPLDTDYKHEFLHKEKYDVNNVAPYEERPVKWFLRKSYLHTLFVMKLTNEMSLTKVPSMLSIMKLGTIERKDLLFGYLGLPISACTGVPNELQLVLLCIVYWYTNTKFEVNRCHVYTMLMSIIMFYYIDGTVGKIRDEESLKTLLEKETENRNESEKNKFRLKKTCPLGNLGYIVKNVDRYACLVAAKNLANYHDVNSKVTGKTIKKHIVQTMCEFQVCFTYIGSLNSLLGSPFLFPAIDKVLNCTFAYNLFIDVTKTPDEGLMLSSKLGQGQQLVFLLHALHDVVGKLVNLPMVLNLFPAKLVTVDGKGEAVTSYVTRGNIKEKLRKEQDRIEKENVISEIDDLVKEFEELDKKTSNKTCKTLKKTTVEIKKPSTEKLLKEKRKKTNKKFCK